MMLSHAQTTCRFCGNLIKLTISRKYADRLQELARVSELIFVLRKRHEAEDCEVCVPEKAQQTHIGEDYNEVR